MATETTGARPAMTRPAAVRKPLAARLPWNDKAGRFAPLKAVTLVLLCLPALWLGYRFVFIGSAGPFGVGPRPITEAIHRLGDWTVYFLLITLAVTPARRLFDWSKLIQVRRMIGIAALTYILGHFTLFVLDSKLDLVFVAREIVFRIYLTIGFTAILGLIALGVTSTDGMIKRMGAREWNTLHNLIYPIAVLAILHYYMQSKVDVTQPVLMSGFFFWLMGWRLLARFGIKEGLAPLLLLSVTAAFLTALAEATWYGIATGIGFRRPFFANLDFSGPIRPAWWVLLAGLTATAVAEVRGRMRGPARRGRAAAAA
jgi:sulfoxide reductase heme-binding subunit YedZ